MLIFPIKTSYKRKSIPWMNILIIAVNLGLFFTGFNGNSLKGMARIHEYMLDPVGPQLSQFFSCIFLHANLMHLLGNMVFLWVFGNAINDKLGNAGYLAFYLAGGVLACVGYLSLSGHAPVLGASGAIAAVAGAYLVLLPRTHITLVWFVYILIPFEVSSLYFIVIQFVFEMYMTFQGLAGPASGGVAYAAHASGYIFGILIAFALLACRLIVRDDLDCMHLISHHVRQKKYQRMVSSGYDPFGRTAVPESMKTQPKGKTVETVSVTSTGETEETTALRNQITAALGRYDLAEACVRYLELTAIMPRPILPRQQHLDIANQLMASKQYTGAAAAYEVFLEAYPNYEHRADIQLMLGIVYGRYLHETARAIPLLEAAAKGLTDPASIDMANDERRALER